MGINVVTRKHGGWWIAEIPAIKIPSAHGKGTTTPRCYASTRMLAIEGVLKIVNMFPPPPPTSEEVETDNMN